MVSPDGKLLVTGALSSGNSLPWLLRECTYIYGRTKVTVSGRLLRHGKTPLSLLGDLGPLWMSPTGRKMIIPALSGKQWNRPVTGLLAGDQVEPLPGSATIGQVTLFPGAATVW